MSQDLSTAFKDIFGHEPYEFQTCVAAHLLAGRNVILRGPTGVGKTKAALFPLFLSWVYKQPDEFPQQGMYITPLRVLLNQFHSESEPLAMRLSRNVRIQSGEQGDDPRFEADLTFTTIDQILSSFLTIPYSLSDRLANLNAGAMISSYLVFDEVHLFPINDRGEGALATTLHMLKMLKGITSFILMTATLSSHIIDELCKELDAANITLKPEDLENVPSQRGKERYYQFIEQKLDPDLIVQDVLDHQRQRVICVCNTVDRAQRLTLALRNDARLRNIRIELIHSRFYSGDRSEKERNIRREFGKQTDLRQWGPAILVATPVIEVGLDITSDILHTEVAPASALIQRAGRCARFAGETGEVRIYDVPLNDQGQRDYAPYVDPQRGAVHDDFEGQVKLCERTREECSRHFAQRQLLTYNDELYLIDATHKPFDEQMVEKLKNNQSVIGEQIKRAFSEQDRRTARDLIRHIDNRSVIIHPNPNETTVPFPYRYQSISLRRNTLLAWYKDALSDATVRNLDWVIKVALPVSDEEKYREETEAPEQEPVSSILWWNPLFDAKNVADAIVSGGIIVINPMLVQYDADIGFRFGGGDAPASESPFAHHTSNQPYSLNLIRRESYVEHIAGLYRFYQSSLHNRTAAARRRLERAYVLPEGLLDRAIRLMFAVHDLGKLDQKWQKWAHRWQEKVSQIRNDSSLNIARDYMAAHTDFNAKDERETKAERTMQPRRPPHAAESALAAHGLISAIAGEHEALYAALMTAILCHHNPTLRENHGEWKPVQHYAKKAFNEAMRAVELVNDPDLVEAARKAKESNKPLVNWEKGFDKGRWLSSAIINPGKRNEVILYLFLVRILRLADQGSQIGAGNGNQD